MEQRGRIRAVEPQCAASLRPRREDTGGRHPAVAALSEAIQGGLSHVVGLPLIDLRGDEAIVTSYLQIIQLDRQAAPRDLPNHGPSHRYRIHRVVVNRWHLIRRDTE